MSSAPSGVKSEWRQHREVRAPSGVVPSGVRAKSEKTSKMTCNLLLPTKVILYLIDYFLKCDLNSTINLTAGRVTEGF